MLTESIAGKAIYSSMDVTARIWSDQWRDALCVGKR